MLSRLFIADAHPVVLGGLRNLFGADPTFEVVASCSNGVECLTMVRRLRPDIALIDMSMPGLNTTELLDVIRDERLGTRVVVFSPGTRDEHIPRHDLRRVDGLLFKGASLDELREYVRDIARGQRQSLASAAKSKLTQNGCGSQQFDRALTAREQDLAKSVAQGFTNQQIADRLEITEGTVKMHLHNIYRKVGIGNRTALANWFRDQSAA